MALELSKIQEALGEDYTLREEIGHGGMAVVFLADDHRHSRKVAVKVLKEEFVGSAHADRFLREIKLEGQLQHSHILPVFDSGASKGLLYFIMPFVEGGTLRDRLNREGMLPLEEALRIGKEIAEALDHAHSMDVVHRDIKPANILLRDGHALVADFGIAKALEESAGTTLTQTGTVIGTPAYLSPEQAGGEVKLDSRSDLYSLGCVFHEMLGGEPPFTGPTTQSILAKHLNETTPSLATVRPDLPPGVVLLVRKLLSKVPADRYQSATELLRMLENPKVLEKGPPPSFLHRVLPWAWVRRIALVAVLAGLALLIYKFLDFGPPSPQGDLNPNKVAVFPLADRSGLTPDGGGIEELIGMALLQTEPLRFQTTFNWLSAEQRTNASLVTNEDARRISRSLEAGYYITGQILRRPDSVSVALTLHDTEGRIEAHTEYGSAVLGPEALEVAGSQAIINLLPALVDPEREIDFSHLRNLNPAAIANWIQGEREYRLSRFEAALAHYERALSEDSLLTFAAVKGAQAANWSHNEAEAPRLIQAALRPDAPLPGRYRSFLQGLLAYAEGQADTAVVRIREALAEDPNWSEAWMLLAEVHNHLLPRGVSTDSAEAFFLESAKDPGFTPPLIHLTEKAVREGRIDQAREWFSRLQEAQAEEDKLSILDVMIRCAENGPEAVDFVSLAESDLARTYDVAMLLSGGGRQAACARAGFEAVLAVDAWAQSSYSWAAAEAIQRLMVAQGESQDAESFLLTLLQNNRAAAAPMFTAVINALAGASMPTILAMTEENAKGRYGDEYESIRGGVTPWIIGMLYVVKGEAYYVRIMRDHLARTAEESGGARTELLASSLDAHLTLMEGDTARAIALFESLSPVTPRDSLANQLPDALAPERLRLAELYLARADFSRAIETASVFDHPEPTVFVPFVPRSLQIRLEAAAALGNAELVEEYSRRLGDLGREDLLAPFH